MSNEAQYMPFYISDYLADTAHLSTMAHGAYLLLILNYWQRGKPLPDDDRKLAAISRLSPDQWALVADDMAELFQVVDGEWRHKRIDTELAKARAKIDAAKKAGKASAERRQNKAPSNDEQHANDRSTTVQRPFNHKVRLGKDDVAAGSARVPRDSDVLRSALVEAMGPLAWCAERHSKFHVLSEPANWITAGCDLDADILPAIRAKCLSMQQRGDEPRGWKIFEQSVFEARDRRLAPAPAVQQRAASPPMRRSGRESPLDVANRIILDERTKAEIPGRIAERISADGR